MTMPTDAQIAAVLSLQPEMHEETARRIAYAVLNTEKENE